VGARLAESGQPVVFLARHLQVDAFQRKGLTVQDENESVHLQRPMCATDLRTALRLARPQVILLAVKAYDLYPLLPGLRHRGSAEPAVIVSLLNGVGNEQTLADAVGSERVLGATLTTAVQVVEPGLVRVERRRGLGLHASHPAFPELHTEMQKAGLSPRGYPRLDSLKWSKLMTNQVTNATSAILGWTPAQVFAHPGVYRLEIEALRETAAVMRQFRIPFVNLPGVPVRSLATVIHWPPQITRPLLRRVVVGGRGDKLPSFAYDLARRRSEVLWLNGAVADAAGQASGAAPANATLTAVLMALVNGAEPGDSYTNRPDRLLAHASMAGVPGVAGYNRLR
jgi:2-dehydropantoate 2-reductase